MAQLVHCPECESDFLLPTNSEQQDQPSECQCPECQRTFAVKDLAVRTVHEGRVLSDVDSDAPDLPKLTPGGDRPSLPSFGGTTLASFLREAEERAGLSRPSADPPTPEEAEVDPSVELAPHSFGQTFGNPADREETSEQLEAESQAPEPADPPYTNPFAATSAADLFSFNPPAAEPATTEQASTHDDAPLSEPPPNEFSSRLADFMLPEQPETPDATNDEQNDFAVTIPEEEDEYELQEEVAHPQHSWETSDANLDYSTPLETDEPEFASLHTDGHDDDPSSVGQFRAGGTTGQVARRRASKGLPVRKMVGIVAAGPIGLAIGYIIVLWVLHARGRTDDPIGLAAYLPNAILPATFQSPSSDTSHLAQGPQDNQAPAGSPRRGVEQATFEEPIENPTPDNDPNRFALPEAAQGAMSLEARLIGVSEYTLDDVAAAYNDAQGSAEGLLAGDFAEAAVRPVKGSSYAKLARLAHVVGFLAEDQRDSLQVDQALELYPPLFHQPRHRAEISMIASYWLVSGKRSHAGVFFCGMPDQGVERGSVVEYQFALPDGTTNLTVLTPQRIDPAEFANAERVGVVGNLLEQPTNHIEGYTGTADKAIWAAHLFPIVGE